jgi:ribonuclease HIII
MILTPPKGVIYHDPRQLERLFEFRTPHQKIYGEQLAAIAGRSRVVQQINNLFFSVISNEFSEDDVCGRISALARTDESFPLKLKASNRLSEIRSSNAVASEKVTSFLDHLNQDLGMDFERLQNEMWRVVDSLRAHEESGGIKSLLVNTASQSGVVVPLQIRVQDGKGEVKCLVDGGGDFKTAIERARHALMSGLFLRATDDVLYSLDITEADYNGDSIGLAAAIGMYASNRQQPADVYTAFTGNMNLEGGQFRVQGVRGINQKLDAAVLNGCRRIFIPKENITEVDEQYREKLQIYCVENIVEVLSKLQKTPQPLQGDSLQVRKINELRRHCLEQGWYLSDPKPIQDALQLTATPLDPPELVVNIYNSGAHTPKEHQVPHFQEALDILAQLDKFKIPIQAVNQPFTIKDPELQYLIQQKLDSLGPTERRDEQYCKYSYKFEDGKERVVVKQFTSGKLQLQGSAGELYKNILEIIIPSYNIKNPTAKTSIEDYLKRENAEEVAPGKASPKTSLSRVPFPHIGTDESGKGDYFGPMVVTGVWINEPIKNQLERLGIKDSKLLSDKRCRELASQIRKICRGKFEEVVIPPERYNELYAQFRKEKQNLNHLLAWGHARAIESLLERHPCSCAIADQFGDEKYILSKLMEKGKEINLVQVTKGERYIAVAAASILARDRFLSRLDSLSQKYGIELPKGSSDAVFPPARKIVDSKGSEELKRVAKLHHKTTQRVLKKA